MASVRTNQRSAITASMTISFNAYPILLMSPLSSMTCPTPTDENFSMKKRDPDIIDPAHVATSPDIRATAVMNNILPAALPFSGILMKTKRRTKNHKSAILSFRASPFFQATFLEGGC